MEKVDNRPVLIYVLKHPDTQEVRYVGKTVRSLSRRLGNHIANAKGNKHNKHLSNWILSILAQYNNLINLTEGGDGCAGFIHNEETIEKIRLAKIGMKHSQEFKDAMSLRLKGKPLSEEHKANIGKANRGRKASLETKRKLSETIKAWWAKRKSVGDIVSTE